MSAPDSARCLPLAGHRVVQQTLQAVQTENVAALRAVEVDRLDALQQALWDRALGGNLAAAQAVVRIIEARARVLGLVQTGKPKRARCSQPQTVVVGAIARTARLPWWRSPPTTCCSASARHHRADHRYRAGWQDEHQLGTGGRASSEH